MTWTPCPCCENYWCSQHGQHVHDCPCPPIEEWETNPYVDNDRNQSMTAKKLTIADIRRAAKAQGGTVEPDGVGGYEVLAPEGRRWVDAEVWCYVLPLHECNDPEERQELIENCLETIAGGHEPHPDW